MRSRIKTTLALLMVIPIAGVSVHLAGAQAAPAVNGAPSAQSGGDSKSLPFEIEGGYTYLRANEPPGSCNCFNMQGGNGTFAWTMKDSGFALVGDVAATHAGTIASTGYNLTVVAITGGLRYRPPVKRIEPFGQALFGIAHASGTGAQSPNPEAGNAGAAFALNLGGGVDLAVSRRFSIRAFEADYLLTTFDNGSNNRQNNLRISVGAVIHF
jgi:hypothetical protein